MGCHFLLQWTVPTQGSNPLNHWESPNSAIVVLSLGFSHGSVGKESTCNAGDTGDPGSIPDSPEKEMTTHFSILAWKIPWMEEPGGLQTMELKRVGHHWVIKHTLSAPIPDFRGGERPWRLKWFLSIMSVWWSLPEKPQDGIQGAIRLVNAWRNGENGFSLCLGGGRVLLPLELVWAPK